MRCFECNKRIAFMNYFECCKCQNKYCNIHRYPEKHNCEYDYRLDKIKLEKVEPEKIIKI